MLVLDREDLVALDSNAGVAVSFWNWSPHQAFYLSAGDIQIAARMTPKHWGIRSSGDNQLFDVEKWQIHTSFRHDEPRVQGTPSLVLHVDCLTLLFAVPTAILLWSKRSNYYTTSFTYATRDHHMAGAPS